MHYSITDRAGLFSAYEFISVVHRVRSMAKTFMLWNVQYRYRVRYLAKTFMLWNDQYLSTGDWFSDADDQHGRF